MKLVCQAHYRNGNFCAAAATHAAGITSTCGCERPTIQHYCERHIESFAHGLQNCWHCGTDDVLRVVEPVRLRVAS